jgi:hypothetical protein
MTKQLYYLDFTDPKIAGDFGVEAKVYRRYGHSARQALSHFVASMCGKRFYLVHYFGDRIDRYVWPVEEETVLPEEDIQPVEQRPLEQYPRTGQQKSTKEPKQLPLFKI